MPSFFYKALDRSGKTVKGRLNATNRSEAIEMLRSKNLMPAEIILESKSKGLSFANLIFSTKVNIKEIALLTRQLSILLRSGVPIDQSIRLLIEQNTGPLKKALSEIREDLREGKSLANSMERHPQIFSGVYTHLVRAGEASGRLEEVLNKLANNLERSEKVQNKISEAMRYPVFMMIMIIAVIVFSSTFIVPSVAGTLQDLGGRTPILTEMMLALSSLITNYWYLIIGGIAALILSFTYWKKTEKGSLQFDTLLLKTPLVSRFTKTKAIVQFSQILGMLLDAGVNFSEALDLVSKVVSNKVLSSTLSEARSNIIREGKIAKHLERTEIFPPIAHYMIKVGEESGHLSQMLLQVGNDYEEELLRTTETLVSAINPIMTILIAAVVLLVILSIFLPILEMSNIGQLGGI